MNEYGGCLPFEINRGHGYWDEYNKIKVDVDSGRSAIQYILETNEYKRIWLPVYNCPLVGKRIQEVSRIEIHGYNLNEDFSPKINKEDVIDGDIILWVNYWGIVPERIIDLVEQYQYDTEADVIIDNIPAYFAPPREEVYNIYSGRKFLGVPEGGHVIGKHVKRVELPIQQSAERYMYLLKAIEQGSNAVYSKYQENEELFTNAHVVYRMSKLTKSVLDGIQYDRIIEARKSNFQTLHNILGKHNRLTLDENIGVPSVYPLFSKVNNLHERLVDNRIFVSRYWKHVLTNECANPFERDLAACLVPIPIDQRYNSDDMENMAHKVLELLNEK